MKAGERWRRGRPWWRSRTLVAVVVALDAIGGGAMAYVLTRPSPSTLHGARAAAGPPLRAHPKDPLARTGSAPPAATARPHPPPQSRHRRRRIHAVSAGTRDSFAAFSAAEPGRIGVAIAPLGRGPVRTVGSFQTGHAWSTMKVPVLTTLLDGLESRGRRLGAAGRQDATLALEESNNLAADALFSGLEGKHGGLVGASLTVQRTLRRAGDEGVHVNTAPNNGGFTTWGQTEWSAAGEVEFYRSLARGCLLSPGDTRYVTVADAGRGELPALGRGKRRLAGAGGAQGRMGPGGGLRRRLSRPPNRNRRLGRPRVRVQHARASSRRLVCDRHRDARTGGRLGGQDVSACCSGRARGLLVNAPR